MKIENVLTLQNRRIDFACKFKFKVSVFKNNILVVMMLLSPAALHAAEHHSSNYYSNYVGGNSYQKNSAQFLNFIDENFYSYEGDEKKLDVQKMRKMQAVIKAKHRQLLDSFHQSVKIEFINRHQFSDKRSDRRAARRTGREARVNLPFIVFDERIESLIENRKNLNADEIENEISTLMIYYQVVESYENENLYKETLESVKSLLPPWYDIPKLNSPEEEALNLLDNGEFLSSKQLVEKHAQEVDFSLLDPPNSAFWKNNNIEDFDPNSEQFFGEQFFPQADAIMVYDRMGTGQIKIKADFYQAGTKDVCKTDLDNGNVTLRLGQETQNQLIATQLARSVGYPAIPHVYRPQVKMYLCDTTFEAFVAQWKVAHNANQGNFLTYGQYLKEENAVLLKGVALESYPGDNKDRYRKVGPFNIESMNLGQRREWRAWLALNALIGLLDVREENFRLDMYKPQGDGQTWQPLLYFNDLGRSLGFNLIRTHGAASDFRGKLAKDKGDYVRMHWDHYRVEHDHFQSTTAADVKWMIRRLARLSDQQINDIVDNSGHIPAAAALYKTNLKLRIESMINAFDLSDEVQTDHDILSYEQLAIKYPGHISKKGKLLAALETESQSTRPLGYTPSINEILAGAFATLIQLPFYDLRTIADLDDFSKATNFNFSGDTFELGLGVRARSQRRLSLNEEKTKFEKRYLVEDTVLISIPIGLLDRDVTATRAFFTSTLPLGISYVYEYKYYHSYDTIAEAAKTHFFKRLMPWKLQSIKNDFSPGEAIYSQTSFQWSIGSFQLETASDEIGFEVTPLGFSQTLMANEFYAYKQSPDLVEVVKTNGTSSEWRSGVDLTVLWSIAALYSNAKENRDYSYFRFDFSSDTRREKTAKALDAVLQKNNFDLAREFSATYNLLYKSHMRDTQLCFLAWCRVKNNQDETFNIKEYANAWQKDEGDKDKVLESQTLQPEKERFVIQGQRIKSSDRLLGRIWNEEITLGGADPIIDFFLGFRDEAYSQRIIMESVYNPKKKKVTDIDVRVQLIKTDNWMKEKEFEKLKGFFGNRAVCDNKEEAQQYFDFEYPENLKAMSPVAAQMTLQLKKSGVNQLISELRQDKANCKKRCQKRLNKLANYDLKTLQGAQDFNKKFLVLLEGVLGKKLRKQACLKDLLEEDQFWLIARITNPLRYTTPAALDNMSLFAPEQGEYLGPSYLDKFRYEHSIEPILSRKQVVPDELSRTSGPQGFFTDF